MSGFGHSSSSSQANTTSNTTTNNTSKNINVQPSGGGATFGELHAGGNVTTNVITTDEGAINSALSSNTDIAKATIDAATTINSDSLSLAKSISQNVTDFASQTNSLVASTVSDSNRSALQFGENAFSTVEQALSGSQTAFNNAATIAATSTSSQYASTQTIKYVLIGVGLLAVALVIVTVRK